MNDQVRNWVSQYVGIFPNETVQKYSEVRNQMTEGTPHSHSQSIFTHVSLSSTVGTVVDEGYPTVYDRLQSVENLRDLNPVRT